MNNEEAFALSASVPLFSVLSTAERKALCKEMITRTYKDGVTIVHEEEAQCQTFFIIVSGKVNVVVTSSEGKQTILATLKKGDFFGEMAILDGEPRSASVVAADACVLFMLYRRSFLSILEQYPKIAVQMLVAMSKRLRASNRQINTLSLMSVYGRVAEVLVRLGAEQGRRIGSMVIITHRPTHQRIAEMANTSRETVSRVLSQLQKKRYINIDRKRIILLDEEKLYD